MGDTLDYLAKYDTVYGGAFVSMIVIATLYYVFRPRSTISSIVGPPHPSWIFGHMLQLMLPLQYGDHEFQWQKTYGPVYRIKGCFGQDRLIISDPVAIQYILNTTNFDHAPIFHHTIYLAEGGQSLSYVQGNTHKRLRAAMNVGFNAAAVRKYQPVFENLAHELVERLEATSGSTVDILPPLGIATLSAICDAQSYPAFLLQTFWPMQLEQGYRLGYLWQQAISQPVPLQSFGKLDFSRNSSGPGSFAIRWTQQGKGWILITTFMDHFSWAVAAGQLDARNSAMSGDEIAGQTALFLLAGHETATNAVSFALLELARSRAIQERLRAEINETLGAVAYDNMPLLNAVIKETLRLYPGLPMSERIAVSDAVIPLKIPVTSSEGEQITAIPVRKGQLVTVATASYHRLASRWGNDSDEFKPSRWIDGTIQDENIIGPYANLGVFSGGPRTCLGWRFSILEIQVLLCELIGNLSFTLPEDSDNIVRPKYAGSLMPTLSSGEKGLMLRVNKIG
ncbi:cytochrome P450 [Mycena leptocephala]|nr:cytochrome P450 [Mycena leptocephala]